MLTPMKIIDRFRCGIDQKKEQAQADIGIERLQRSLALVATAV
jgi:hypothetical protein